VGNQEFITASTLRIHCLAITISLRGAYLDNDSMYDIFLPEFCEIVALCRSVAGHPLFTRGFVFDASAGIIPCLFLVITKCRDRLVRRDAVNVLRMIAPRREGVWHSSMVARIGEELLGVEDEDAVADVDWAIVNLHCLSTTVRLPRIGASDSNPLLAFENEVLGRRAGSRIPEMRFGKASL